MGPVTIKRLWEHFGSIEVAWKADEQAVLAVDGLNQKAVQSFLKNRSQVNPNEEYDLVRESDVQTSTLDDESYPELLKNIYDPPPVLYVKGQLPTQKTLAIVGTRRATRYGLEMAKKLAYELASCGITVVSGLAAGIDTEAHKGALEAKGKTIAVFGCGVDTVYPASNRSLAKEIESSGALVSEFPLGVGTEKGNFPRRNRIISGLSLGTIVIEGHYKSGAMITAKQALDQGREVFAVPGQAGMEQSMGPHWLIKQGAKLVESVDDVLEELNIEYRAQNAERETHDFSGLSSVEQEIVKTLSREPKHIDNISLDSRLAIPQVSSLLLMLEMKKIVRQVPGKMFLLA
ncbi:MAG: DNA-processing protein DprA [bacterium]